MRPLILGGTTVRVTPGPGGRPAIEVKGSMDDLARAKLGRLVLELGVREGVIRAGRDVFGRPRTWMSAEVPEREHQRIRNVLQNFDKL